VTQYVAYEYPSVSGIQPANQRKPISIPTTVPRMIPPNSIVSMTGPRLYPTTRLNSSAANPPTKNPPMIAKTPSCVPAAPSRRPAPNVTPAPSTS